MSELGLPFQGLLWYWEEDSYGETELITSKAVSCKIQVARPGIGDRHKELRGIDSPLACHLLEQAKDYTFHLEYIPQCDDELITTCINRKADCKLQTFGFDLTTNKCEPLPADKSLYSMIGCKPKTVRLAASHNNEYLITIDFSVKDIGDELATVAPDALEGAYLQFNTAGAIRRDLGAGMVDVAYILDSIDISVEHNIKDYWDHDTVDKQFAVEGEMGISGSCDISLNEGGGVHFNEVVTNVPFELQLDMGGEGCPRITLPGCQWKTSEIDVGMSGEAMMESAPFTAKPASATAIVTEVPSEEEEGE